MVGWRGKYEVIYKKERIHWRFYDPSNETKQMAHEFSGGKQTNTCFDRILLKGFSYRTRVQK